MNKINIKFKFLNDYLLEKYHISLYEILEEDENTLESIFNGNEYPNKNIIHKTSEFFYLNEDILTDDNKELPNKDSLAIDENLLSIRKNEYEKELGKKKHKNVIKRNFNSLDNKKKHSLIRNLILTCIPFVAFALYSYITVSINRVETLNSYRTENTLSESQKQIEDSLPQKSSSLYYNSVNIGAQLERINEISSSNNSFNVTMSVRFDLDQLDFHKMWWQKQKNEVFNADNFYSEEELMQDCWQLDSTGEKWLNYPDNIPDVIQFNFEDNNNQRLHLDKNNLSPTSISTLYQAEKAAYPGEKSSNVFTDKNDEFSIGNGKISPDSLEYSDKGTAYYDEESKSYRYGQKVHFTATINKKFDSPRYPLDSVQFHIYIQPNRTTDYIRYVPDSQMSGFSTYFSISGGYRLINENNGAKNFVLLNNYYVDTDLDRSSKTFGKEIIKSQLEIIVRANKHGFSVFLNSFLNIIAVACWLILAFFNQSFNKDDSISMIGTGFFSAISAILLGFSIVSNADSFSLLSVINIFTLGMVLVMGYECIAAKHANKLNDASLIAYRNCKIRCLFYFFILFALLMYIILPAISYLWML